MPLDRFETNSWQTRWSGLADRLEIALENTFYRTCLCAASVALVLVYAYFATRFAQPTRWISNRLIIVSNESSFEPQFLEIDAINRSIVRLQRLASVLQIKPTPLVVQPDQPDLERHVLRLWLDEVRGNNFEGMYDVVSEAMVRAILVVVFDHVDASQESSANWFSNLRTFRETCEDPEILAAHPQWRGLCATVSLKTKSDFDRPNPMSLSKWLSRQVVAEASELGPSQRIMYLRGLVAHLSNPELAKFERLDAWPAKSVDFGPPLKELVSLIAPAQARRIDFSPRVFWIRMSVEKTDAAESLVAVERGSGREMGRGTAVDVDLVVLTSCEAPSLKRVVALNEVHSATEVLWAKVCDAKKVIVEANSAHQFAEKNPDVVFVQIGVREIGTALKRGWLNEGISVVEMLKSSTPTGRGQKTTRFSDLMRTQRTDWDTVAKAFRIRAPVEVVKLVRIDSAIDHDFRDL